MRIANGIPGSQYTKRRRLIEKATLTGVYTKKIPRQVSKKRPKLSMSFFIPCSMIDSLRVLQIRMSAHCTMMMEIKNAVWARPCAVKFSVIERPDKGEVRGLK